MSDTNDSKAGNERWPTIPAGIGHSPVCCWDELVSSLNVIKSLESFSSIKTYPYAANPVIQINEQVVALPLTELGAKIIKQVSGHTNAKDGAQPAIATSVWEIDAQSFNILSPDWPSFLNMILTDACRGLGLTEFVDAEPYKLFLCEKDGFPHWQDKTGEMAGMLAVLAIYLPSAHKGGVVRLSHAGQDCTFDISEQSMFATRALAWSTSAAYQAEQIVAGRRLMLIYRIVDKSMIHNSASKIHSPIEIVAQALCRCVQQAPNFTPKIYGLDHQYPRGKLSLSTLKGHDYAVCKALKDSCSQHGFYLLLGHLEKQRTTLDHPENDGGTYTDSNSDVDNKIDIGKDSVTLENSPADEDSHTDEDRHAEENTVSVDLLDGMNGDVVAKSMISTKNQVLRDPYREDRITSSGGSVFSDAVSFILPRVLKYAFVIFTY